ncbi:MAG: peptide ABC transporter substrate-binding protein [Candidatus Velthaea sp.]
MGVRALARGAAAALLVLAVERAAHAQDTRHAYTIPHVLRYATAEDIVGLNAHLNQQSTLAYMSSLTMAWLVRFDHDNKPVPELATAVPTRANGGISADGKTITYRLRTGVKWSDGADFTSADVKFSADVVLDPDNNEGTHVGFDKLTAVHTPDPSTIVFRLREPHAQYAANFFGSAGGNPCILPKHKFTSTKINTAPYNDLPVGIGPFKYASWKRGDSVEMVPDPLYFRGRPKLERVVFKLIPDRNTVLTQLTTHELDMWLPVPPAFADRVHGLGGIDVVQQPSYLYDHIDLNQQHGPLDDLAVRRALRYAIDRRAILAKVRHGAGVLQESPMPPTHPLFAPSIPRIPFDLAAANAMLERAGWRRGSDGIRAKNGKRLEFVYASSAGVPDTDQQIELIRTWWRQIGADFTVRRYLSSLLFAPYGGGGILYGGKYDVTNFAWTQNPLGDMTNIYACDRVPPKGQNVGRYCNPMVDRAMRRLSTTYDPAEQRAASRYIQEQMVRDVATIVLEIRKDTFAYNSDLHGFRPNQVTPFDDFMNVDI